MSLEEFFCEVIYIGSTVFEWSKPRATGILYIYQYKQLVTHTDHNTVAQNLHIHGGISAGIVRN